MTWTVVYRLSVPDPEHAVAGVGNRKADRRRMSLGEYPTVGLAEARQRTLEIKRLVRAGLNPAPQILPEAQSAFTVRSLFELYRAEHLARNIRSGSNVEKLLSRHVLPAWGSRDLTSIAARDLVSLLEQIRVPSAATVQTDAGSYEGIRGGPGAAAEVRKWTRSMFQFAVERQHLADNPLSGVKNRDRQRPRSRVLTMEELSRIWQAASELAPPWSAYFQLIMLTGDRRSEWADARVEWISADGERLEIPAAYYKTGKAQVVPLARQARVIVGTIQKPLLGPYIISTTGGERPVSGFSKAKARIDEIIARDGALEPWVVHDLRRSMATHMERLGVAPHIIEVCLGHTLKGIGATYRHYAYLPEKAAALQLWADELVDAKIANRQRLTKP
jgi:integrase